MPCVVPRTHIVHFDFNGPMWKGLYDAVWVFVRLRFWNVARDLMRIVNVKKFRFPCDLRWQNSNQKDGLKNDASIEIQCAIFSLCRFANGVSYWRRHLKSMQMQMKCNERRRFYAMNLGLRNKCAPRPNLPSNSQHGGTVYCRYI